LDLHLPGRTVHKALAIVVAVLVVSFALQAAGHWHNRSFEDQHCRVCHVAHSVTVDLSHGTGLPAPDAVVRLVQTRPIDLHLELISHQVSSRAPPA
jgi:hypothetical protein